MSGVIIQPKDYRRIPADLDLVYSTCSRDESNKLVYLVTFVTTVLGGGA